MNSRRSRSLWKLARIEGEMNGNSFDSLSARVTAYAMPGWSAGRVRSCRWMERECALAGRRVCEECVCVCMG
eukprot:1873921-Rhodomonas_salina.2